MYNCTVRVVIDEMDHLEKFRIRPLQDSSGSRIHNTAILSRSVLANPQYVDQITVWMTHFGVGTLTTKNYLPRIQHTIFMRKVWSLGSHQSFIPIPLHIHPLIFAEVYLFKIFCNAHSGHKYLNRSLSEIMTSKWGGSDPVSGRQT